MIFKVFSILLKWISHISIIIIFRIIFITSKLSWVFFFNLMLLDSKFSLTADWFLLYSFQYMRVILISLLFCWWVLHLCFLYKFLKYSLPVYLSLGVNWFYFTFVSWTLLFLSFYCWCFHRFHYWIYSFTL